MYGTVRMTDFAIQHKRRPNYRRVYQMTGPKVLGIGRWLLARDYAKLTADGL